MIDLPAEQLELVKKILGRHLPLAMVSVFGSRATGTAKPFSDLDVVIRSDAAIPLEKLYAIRDDLEESDLPIRVDIVDWHAIDDNFKKIIGTHEQPLTEKIT